MRKNPVSTRAFGVLLAVLMLLSAAFVAPRAQTAKPLTKTELYAAFLQYEGLFIYDAAPLYTVRHSLDLLLAYEESFDRYAQLYQVPKSLVEVSVLRELFYYNLLDWGADIFVSAYYETALLSEKRGTQEAFAQIEPLFFKQDASTGVAQIFVTTAYNNAIDVLNWAAETGVRPGGRVYDAANVQDRYDLWFALKDDPDFSIEVMTLIHLRNALLADPTQGFRAEDLSEDEIKWIFARFNTGTLDSDHTVDCYAYFLLFEQYNASEI
ncbi:MAG: hypothetical protein LBS96_10165 [Oscillospiraceae bacterium]|jgi:hypothetical protein|nr:hypothetical protein [Oscillospiraceae bacterium]